MELDNGPEHRGYRLYLHCVNTGAWWILRPGVYGYCVRLTVMIKEDGREDYANKNQAFHMARVRYLCCVAYSPICREAYSPSRQTAEL